MNRFATTVFVAGLVWAAVSVTRSAAFGTDKASVSWQEFSERSTFVFGGLLMKAEMLDPDGGPGGGIRCTYKVSDTFKGEAVKEVTFDVPREEGVNTEVGTLAVVALRREGDRWLLSVDGRSCWKQRNRMKPDFGGFPVYDLPAGLIRDLPPELSEKLELLVPAGDGKVRTESVFPMDTVRRELGHALGRHDEATDPIERLVTRLSADPLWQNGISPVIDLPPTASTEQVVSKVFEMISFDRGRVKHHKTLEERAVQIRGSLPDRYTAALVETDFGEKIVLLQHQGEVVGWWSRVFEIDLSPPAAETDAKAPAANIAAEVERLASPSIRDDRDAAVQALVRIGKPAAPALVKALDDPRNDVRAGAAEALRTILAADPTAAPNNHDREYWEKRAAELTVGMSLEDAVAALLPDATPEERKSALEMGVWSGPNGISVVRLDDYWTARLQLVDAGREKLGQAPPALSRSVRPVWVQPPADYTGPWATWFVNGQKSRQIQYRNGQYHGTFTAFHDDGSKSYEQHYEEGV